jgi:Raf kinase inhibitor-like YbhB/YbcL family protein
MSITVRSTAIEEGQPVPGRHTEDGEDISPELSWEGLPEGTEELALIVDDPDAPTAEPWVHWVIYKIPPGIAGLAEGVPYADTLAAPAGALQGRNTWGTIGYRWPGPAPRARHPPLPLQTLRAGRAPGGPPRARQGGAAWPPCRDTSWTRGNWSGRTSDDRGRARPDAAARAPHRDAKGMTMDDPTRPPPGPQPRRAGGGAGPWGVAGVPPGRLTWSWCSCSIAIPDEP